MSTEVLLEWNVYPQNASSHHCFTKRMKLAAAPKEGDYIVHDDGWAAEIARSVMICEEYVFVRFKTEYPATAADSELIQKLGSIGWEET